MFWHSFLHIFVKSLVVAPHCRTAPPTLFYCYYRPKEGGRTPFGLWSAVRCWSSQHSYQFLVLDCAECRVQWDLSWVCFLALSKLFDGAALFWANSLNSSTLLHTYQILEEVNLDHVKARSKLSGPLYLTDLPDPGSIRVKGLHV
jgi:hypothetical protein